ncbi:hypothetical protein CKO22_04910 [Thiococcus pfennigii]|nr:hypothetical protein [Thiococcus pfennigii]
MNSRDEHADERRFRFDEICLCRITTIRMPGEPGFRCPGSADGLDARDSGVGTAPWQRRFALRRRPVTQGDEIHV